MNKIQKAITFIDYSINGIINDFKISSIEDYEFLSNILNPKIKTLKEYININNESESREKLFNYFINFDCISPIEFLINSFIMKKFSDEEQKKIEEYLLLYDYELNKFFVGNARIFSLVNNKLGDDFDKYKIYLSTKRKDISNNLFYPHILNYKIKELPSSKKFLEIIEGINMVESRNKFNKYKLTLEGKAYNLDFLVTLGLETGVKLYDEYFDYVIKQN